MYRVTKMGITVFALKFDRITKERNNIEALLESGNHVLLVNDLADAAEVLDIEENEIVVVEAEE